MFSETVVESGVLLALTIKAYFQVRVSWVDSLQHSELSNRVNSEAFFW